MAAIYPEETSSENKGALIVTGGERGIGAAVGQTGRSPRVRGCRELPEQPGRAALAVVREIESSRRPRHRHWRRCRQESRTCCACSPPPRAIWDQSQRW